MLPRLLTSFLAMTSMVFSFPSTIELSPEAVRNWAPEWQSFTSNLVSANLKVLQTAQDIETIYPKFLSLKTEQKTLVLTIFFREISRFESGFNPAAESVDVGSPTDKNTWSVGLFQVSQVDQESFKLPTDYSYEELKTPEPNIHLAMQIMVRQIRRKKKFLIPRGEPGLYWAVIHPGGKYDHSKEILKVVQSLKF